MDPSSFAAKERLIPQDDVTPVVYNGRRGSLLCKSRNCMRRPPDNKVNPSSCLSSVASAQAGLSLWEGIRRFSVCRRIQVLPD